MHKNPAYEQDFFWLELMNEHQCAIPQRAARADNPGGSAREHDGEGSEGDG
jgi:hypothetical protein